MNHSLSLAFLMGLGALSGLEYHNGRKIDALAAALAAQTAVELDEDSDQPDRLFLVHDKSRPELNDWFNGLASGKGPCCSNADGTALSDVDWETKDGHYRVRIDGVWYDVPEDAVLTGPNRAGVAMVWPIRLWAAGKQEIAIRCFIPGPGA